MLNEFSNKATISESEKMIYRFYPNDNGGAVLETYSNIPDNLLKSKKSL